MKRGIGALLGFALLFTGLAVATPAAAQTATTGVIGGRVVDASGTPRGAGENTGRNEATGGVRTTLTKSDGRYLGPGLQVGGPYTVTAEGLGLEALSRSGLQLALGQNLVV